MLNNAAHDTRTTDPGQRVAAGVALEVAARAAASVGGEWPAEFDGTPAVFDGFEDPTMTPTLNTKGFVWSPTEASSIVTMDPDPLRVYRNGLTINERPDDLATNWTAKTGGYSMNVLFRAGSAISQQSFNVANPGILGMWLAFDLRVPTNFYHNHDPEGPEYIGNNNKLMRLWTDAYSGSDGGSKVGMSFRRDGDADDGSSYYFCKIFGPGQSGSDKGKVRFITTPQDRGKWMRLVFRVQFESVLEASDGSLEVWRKWEDESEFTKDFNYQNERICTSNSANITGFAAGYLMGASNAHYAEDTEFLIDNFEIAELTK